MDILIVDDEPIITLGLEKIISKFKISQLQIFSKNTGAEALEFILDYPIDLVITDIEMPEMTGFELINKINRLISNPPDFCILSGYDEKNYLMQAIKMGVLDYLLKPIDKEELFSTILKSQKQNTNSKLLKTSLPLITEYKNFSSNVQKIIEFVEKNYSKNITLELLAEAVYLHPTYISSLFKKETGITFIHFLHSYRIEQAKILMRRNPNLSINEVSIIVGYENPRHFFALFKKYNDLTPGKYRESLALHN